MGAMQVTTAADILSAERLIFPGVGAFEQAMGVLTRKDFVDPLREYIQVLICQCSHADFTMHASAACRLIASTRITC